MLRIDSLSAHYGASHILQGSISRWRPGLLCRC
jgi:hypothetical protein